jgi:hypothetical protein
LFWAEKPISHLDEAGGRRWGSTKGRSLVFHANQRIIEEDMLTFVLGYIQPIYHNY